MSDIAPRPQVVVTPEQRAGVFALYDRGLYLQAYRAAEAIGPIQHWRGTESRILAGRIAGNLGSMRLADWHFVHAWRKDRKHAEALWFYARYLLAARGPLAAWRFVESQPFPKNASRELRSHWASQHAAILGQLRDFDAAQDWLKKAEAIGIEPWTCIERATLYSLEDRHEEAEAAARRALELRPWYRPAVQWVAHFLVQKERDVEAFTLLTEASQRLESGAVWAQLAALQIELDRYDDAARSLDEYERFSPLLYKKEKEWLDVRRADLACRGGDYEKAIGLGKKVKGKHFENLVERLSKRNEPCKRVEIPVGFVRQHHKTCGPATLTSIAKFWSMPAEHVELAEEIAFCGTPYHSERRWANDNGWYTKAFTVTWEALVALIDRGIPFTLATLEVTSGHLQAVIGYDSGAGTLIIRDPGDRHKVEMSYDLMKERYRSSGPRGMAMVPIAHKEKLAGLSLPDEEMYELLLKFDLALVDHRRADADKALKAMEREGPGHYLPLQARRSLAIYDADQPAGLLATEQLLQMFPDDQFLELARADYLRHLGRREQRLEILKRLAEKKDSDPACWHFYAQELSIDARNDPQTTYLLRKAIRATPGQAPLQGRLLETLARIRWSQTKFDEALELYHFAACNEDKDEYIAQNYFLAFLGRGRTDEALQFLQTRFRRFGARSNQAARTLHWAYMQLGRSSEAFDALDEAIRLRPNDGELLTYSADMHTFKAEFERAQDILAKAAGVSKPAARLRSLAYLEISRDQRRAARDLWAEVLKIEPLAEDAHRNYAQLLAEEERSSAALAHVADACRKFPHHFGLVRLWYEWTQFDGPQAREQVLKKLLGIQPADAWTRVEYAYLLADQERMEEAHRQLDDAEPLEPDGPNVWFARGMLFKRQYRTDDAMHALRESIRHSVDFEAAIHELLWQCENLADRRDAVAFIVSELLRQPTSGGGIFALAWAAQPIFPPDELLTALRRVRDARPDLWQAWVSVTRQAGYLERRDEYLASAQKAIQAFPANSDAWLDLAEAQRVNNNKDAELQALERAVELAPNYERASRMLAEAHERADAFDLARRTLEQAVARAPLVSVHYLHLADHFWRRHEHEPAIRQVERCLKLEPGFDVAWNSMCNWCLMLDRYDEVMALAKSWTGKRPGDARSWLRLAQALQWQGPRASSSEEKERIDQCTAAYQEALERNPRAREIHDFHAEMLALAGRFEEARKACQPPAWKGKPPIELRGRAAWIKAQEGEFEAAKALMGPILKEDRFYRWGWDQLVDWCFATQQFKEYLDAANDFLRSRPQSALAMTFRGEARVRMEEREAGLDDLRSAFRKDPCNSLAGFILFDEQMVDDNLVGAEATLLSLQQNIVGDYVKARLVQLQAKRENQAIALDIFKGLCTTPFPVPPAMDLAMRALDMTSWKEQAEQILKDAMKEKNWNLHVAQLFAERWNPNAANDLPERIAAIDRALEKQPGALNFLALKAELLSSGAQFERAWQVCQEKTFPLDQYQLEARAALVMFRSGRTQDAIAKMREILKEHPKFIWGWQQIADWYSRQQQWVEVLAAGEQLVLIAPRDPVGFGWRGLAKQNLNDPQAARADYVHALDLQPWYIWGAWQLFNMYVSNQEWQRAEKVLEKAQKYADKGEWAQRKVDLLVYLNRKSAFPKEFENLCKHSAKAPWLLDQSLAYLVHVGWWSDAEEVLHRCLDMGPHVCDPWVRLRVNMGDRRVGDDIQDMAESRPERTNCIAAYAIELAYAKDASGLRQWILTHEDALREDTPCWAKVASALYVVQDWNGIIEWCTDWPDHPKALPNMLLPLVKAYRSVGRLESARKVGLHCLTKLNPDYASSFHKVWLMYDQALDGDILPVQRYLEQADLGGFDGYHQMIAAEVRALWLMLTDKEHGFTRGRQVLADTARYAPPTLHDPALAMAYQQCVSKMAEQQGTFGARLWRWWRWLLPKLPQAPQPQG